MKTGETFFGFGARIAGAVAICPLLCLIVVSGPLAEIDPLDAPLEVVRFGEDDTIRGVVSEHLGDPDLWPTVLRINDIASPADIVPGVELRLPVRQVAVADSALASSLAAIQLANVEGAQIFAPSQIGSAIENRETAIQQRELGAWREVVNFSGVATEFANEALEISIAQRDRSAEAVVSDVQGSVEGRAPVEPSWSDRALNDILVEFERLRTLSNSTTQVTFRDLSRLRLNPNSNATIQRMRADPLTGGEVTKVSLVNGDFYALLNQLSEKSEFEIEVPGIETTTNSADFWIKNDQTGARFVNYDDQDLEIRRGEDVYEVGENEGVVLAANGAQRTEVLDSPRLSSPPLGSVIYGADTALSWEEYTGAEAYWIEIARDPAFNQMELSEWGIRGTRFEAPLPPARYHWRVAALDPLGLPGQWSTAQDFTVRVDDTPPFLTLLSPAEGAILSSDRVDVLGATEAEASVELNGSPLAVASDGSFLVTLDLVPGPNTVSVSAVDPAGNPSTRSLTVIYRPGEVVDVTFSDDIPVIEGALATRSESLTVRGKATATDGAPLIVRDVVGDEIVRTVVESDGSFAFVVPATPDPTPYILRILAPNGRVEGEVGFAAVQDSLPPKIVFDQPPLRATSDAELRVDGSAGDAASLTIDGTPVPLSTDGRFELIIPLVSGDNRFDLVATDAVGNVSLSRVQTLLDTDPPEILRVEIARPDGGDGTIDILAEAQDASGLVQAAPFVLAIDGVETTGFLRCDSATGLCRGSLPPQPGEIELIELIVEDYAGNTAFE